MCINIRYILLQLNSAGNIFLEYFSNVIAKIFSLINPTKI